MHGPQASRAPREQVLCGSPNCEMDARLLWHVYAEYNDNELCPQVAHSGPARHFLWLRLNPRVLQHASHDKSRATRYASARTDLTRSQSPRSLPPAAQPPATTNVQPAPSKPLTSLICVCRSLPAPPSPAHPTPTPARARAPTAPQASSNPKYRRRAAAAVARADTGKAQALGTWT